jgi:uncharacterized protein YecE (DUF72 family)
MKSMSARDQTAKVWVGPAGWDYADWKGVVYPAKAPKGFDRLGYIARYFDTVEINSTFYGPVRAETARTWLAHVVDNPRFRFTAKLWRRFTHERGAPWTADEVRTVRDGFDTLAGAGRLGAVLLQFPWSFRRDDAAEEWLRDLFSAFAAYPLVLEVRHASWNSGDLLAQLAARGVGLVNIDQPLFKSSIGPAAYATGGVGYVRLHGRNYQQWFRARATVAERYDYFYPESELRPWVARIGEIAARPEVREVYAIANNHHLGKAPANAGMIKGMLTEDPAPLPPSLFDRYRADVAPWTVAR